MVTDQIPSATHAGNRLALALASVPFIGTAIWGINHILALINVLHGGKNHLALAWAVSFLLLWWIPVSWLERPIRARSDRQQAIVDRLTVSVHVPVYNEDPELLRRCLLSILQQTRLPTRVLITNDGSEHADGTLRHYTALRDWWFAQADQWGIDTVWVRTHNQGKRYAQAELLRNDTSSIVVTLDSDSVLDRNAIEQGCLPFADPNVTSVAGMVLVWNNKRNPLTWLTCMLYTPFTRSFRSAQSVLGRVMVNSGTLAFYQGPLVRKYLDSYVSETFMGRPMQMNDDSMLTFYGLLAGRTVHQPTAVAFTVVPEKMRHYVNQQLRWMRGTFVRTWWWWRYMPLRDAAFWMPVMEMIQFVLALVIGAVLVTWRPPGMTLDRMLMWTAVTDVALCYVCALRYFMIRRSDEPWWQAVLVFLSAPVAGLWRLLLIRPLYVYAFSTFWRVSKWGTRTGGVEVGIDTRA